LEDENNRLKKIVADLTLDNAMLRDAVRRTEGPRSESYESCSSAAACG